MRRTVEQIKVKRQLVEADFSKEERARKRKERATGVVIKDSSGSLRFQRLLDLQALVILNKPYVYLSLGTKVFTLCF